MLPEGEQVDFIFFPLLFQVILYFENYKRKKKNKLKTADN